MRLAGHHFPTDTRWQRGRMHAKRGNKVDMVARCSQECRQDSALIHPSPRQTPISLKLYSFAEKLNVTVCHYKIIASLCNIRLPYQSIRESRCIESPAVICSPLTVV